jgi:hypothetical protein
MQVFRFKPSAEPGIVNLWLSLPEVRFKAALDAEMPELKLDVPRVFRKIAARIRRSHMQSRNAVALALSFNNHRYLFDDFG